MYTDSTGAATVRIAMPAHMQSSLIFHYNLKFYDNDGDGYDGVSLKRFVMQVSLILLELYLCRLIRNLRLDEELLNEYPRTLYWLIAWAEINWPTRIREEFVCCLVRTTVFNVCTIMMFSNIDLWCDLRGMFELRKLIVKFWWCRVFEDRSCSEVSTSNLWSTKTYS